MLKRFAVLQIISLQVSRNKGFYIRNNKCYCWLTVAYIAMILLKDNALVEQKITFEDIKNRLLGH